MSHLSENFKPAHMSKMSRKSLREQRTMKIFENIVIPKGNILNSSKGSDDDLDKCPLVRIKKKRKVAVPVFTEKSKKTAPIEVQKEICIKTDLLGESNNGDYEKEVRNNTTPSSNIDGRVSAREELLEKKKSVVVDVIEESYVKANKDIENREQLVLDDSKNNKSYMSNFDFVQYGDDHELQTHDGRKTQNVIGCVEKRQSRNLEELNENWSFSKISSERASLGENRSTEISRVGVMPQCNEFLETETGSTIVVDEHDFNKFFELVMPQLLKNETNIYLNEVIKLSDKKNDVKERVQPPKLIGKRKDRFKSTGTVARLLNRKKGLVKTFDGGRNSSKCRNEVNRTNNLILRNSLEVCNLKSQVMRKMRKHSTVVNDKIFMYTRTSIKKSYFRNSDITKNSVMGKEQKNTIPLVGTKNTIIPPITRIVPTTIPDTLTHVKIKSRTDDGSNTETKKRQHQLINTNQTTSTEEQIIALPSDSIHEQPQSYVLLNLDDNLIQLIYDSPIFVDPNLTSRGDNNMVMPNEKGFAADGNSFSKAEACTTFSEMAYTDDSNKGRADDVPNVCKNRLEYADVNSTHCIAIKSNVLGRKCLITENRLEFETFLEIIRNGNRDPAIIFVNDEVDTLTRTHGQQILINTYADNRFLRTRNYDNFCNIENTECNENSILAGRQALAISKADVSQQVELLKYSSKMVKSQLRLKSTPHLMNVNKMVDTNKINTPTTAPLNVFNINDKIIEETKMSITDPLLSQTIAQEKFGSLISPNLQADPEISLAIEDPDILIPLDKNSPVYSLPNLDDLLPINQTNLNDLFSMPLLELEPEECLLNTVGLGCDERCLSTMPFNGSISMPSLGIEPRESLANMITVDEK